MKNKVYRLLLIVFIISLSVFIIGCSSGKKSETMSSEEVNTQEDDVDAESDDVITLKLWAFSWTAAALSDMARDYQAKHPGIKIEVLSLTWEEMSEKLLLAINSGINIPDIAIMDPHFLGTLINIKGLHSIENDVDPAFRKKFIDAAWNVYNYQGHQYGVPIDIDFNVMFYRYDIVSKAIAKAGLKSFPKTWDEFIKVGEIIATDEEFKFEDGSHPYLISIEKGGVYAWEQTFLAPSGGHVFSADYTKPAFHEPNSVASVLFMRELLEKEIATVWNPEHGDIIPELKSGRILIHSAGPWWRQDLCQSVGANQVGKYRIANNPVAKPGNPMNVLGGSCVSITKACKYKKEALDFIKSLYTPKNIQAYYHAVGSPPPVRSFYKNPAVFLPPRKSDNADEYNFYHFFGKQKVMTLLYAAIQKSEPMQLILDNRIEDEVLIEALDVTLDENIDSSEVPKILFRYARKAKELLSEFTEHEYLPYFVRRNDEGER